jgi:peptidoglycan hydrolase-like protein with peptidoglycan-binding domain
MRRLPCATGTLALVVALLLPACAPDGPTSATPTLPPATARVVQTTLAETRTETGTLGFGEVVPVHATGSGTITRIATLGAFVGRGEPLFHVDELPVVAFEGTVPMYRPLRLDATAPLRGADVRQLQENLSAIGYGGFEPTGIYDAATAEVVRSWQSHLGLPVTGELDPGRIVFLPGPLRVAEHHARPGDPVRGAPILGVTGTVRQVSLALRVADLALVEAGRAVPVRVPGHGTVEGRVSRVGTVVRNGLVDVHVTIASPSSLGSLTAAPVEVDFVSQVREAVLAVPIAALLALPDGGYAVEVVDGGTSRIVPVRTGMFASGRVEVAGDGIAAGVSVGVPR